MYTKIAIIPSIFNFQHTDVTPITQITDAQPNDNNFDTILGAVLVPSAVVIFIAITITVIAILTYFMRRAHKTNTAIYDLPAADYEEKVPPPTPCQHNPSEA